MDQAQQLRNAQEQENSILSNYEQWMENYLGNQTVVVQPLEGLEIADADKNITLEIGQTKKLSITKIPGNTTERLTYTSSNTEIATVDKNGTVTAVKPGEATITIAGQKSTNISATAKVTVKSEITWTMNETTGEIKGGGKTLHVGEYVNYQAKVTNATTSELIALNTQLDEYSGCSEQTTPTTHALANEALEWRILDVKDGQLRLISATPTTRTVSANTINLYGANGYNNAIYLIDDACKTLYKSNYASKVQNLKIEDIEKHLTYDYTQYENSNVDTGKYGGTKEYTTYRYYPNIFTKETIGWIDGNKGTELGLSEQKELITGKTQASSKIKITHTYWGKDMTSSDFKNSTYYTLFINNGNNYATYWMSSRCVSAASSVADFLVRGVASGYVGTRGLYDSRDGVGSDSRAFRPVITLKSNVLIGEGNGSSTPYEINM